MKMNIKRSYFIFLIVLIMYVTFVNVSLGIEVNPTKEQIVETINYGEANPGKKIFKTELVAPATFGNWPKFGSGLIKSKLIVLAVMSAMIKKAKKKITEEEVKAIMGSDDLTISYRGGTNVYKIKLRQGVKVIEPKEMMKPEMKDIDPAKHAVFIMASYPYSDLDLSAKTFVMIVKDFGTNEYEVDFSKIK
ncbi:MAG: hypothetical protein ACE5KZ_09735 [Candidatus Scalinduaceae bacterium]